MSTKDKFDDIYGLTPLQKGMLFHALATPDDALYFEQLTCELQGELNHEAFARTWDLLKDRHSVLRTAFVWKGQREPVQVVLREASVPWDQLDWIDCYPATQAQKQHDFLIDDRKRGFSLNRAPLMRITTARLSKDRWFFVWSHHHILMDGWSLPLLMKEFFSIYHAISEGREVILSRIRPYGDYISWLKDWNQDNHSESNWREYLSGFSESNDLGLSVSRQKSDGFLEACLTFSAEETDRLQYLGHEWELTLNTLVQGAWAKVIGQHSGRDDVVFGITVSGRPPTMDQVEAMVGLFINTVPFRTQVNDALSPKNYLKSIQKRQLSMMPHEYGNLADIQRWSDMPGGQSLFDTLLVFENYPMGDAIPQDIGGLSVQNVDFAERTNYALTLVAIPGRELRLKMSFDSSRLRMKKAQRMLVHLKMALLGLTKGLPKVGDIDMIDAGERSWLLERNVDSPVHTAVERNLVAWFENQAFKRADTPAVVHNGQSVSYRKLNQQSNQLARYLQEKGVKAESLVGVYLERSNEMIIGILGVLKAGGAYVPLDPAIPKDRLVYIVEDSKISVLLTHDNMRVVTDFVPDDVSLVNLDRNSNEISEQIDHNLDLNIESHQPAYVIYTSGSTGKPKGCIVTHANVVRLFRSTDQWFAFNEEDVWTLFHSYAFDFSVWEIWGALLYGGRLVVVPYEVSRQPDAFHALTIREGVTVLNQTPSAFRQFIQSDSTSQERVSKLRYVIFGGEALNPATLKPWFKRYGDQYPKLVNMYGITETTVHVTYYLLKESDVLDANGNSPIGQAIPDLELYVLDPNGKLTPTGVAGELHVGGAGLARGYLHRPELTQSKFIRHPFSENPDSRLYRTGDLARWSEDGGLDYLGRIDEQVKIRGFRIELGEIESTLTRLSDVAEALVVAHGGTLEDKRLAAYIVPKEKVTLKAGDLREHLTEWLPDYMVPSDFVLLDCFPLTPNGKIDRKALPDPQCHRAKANETYVAPINEDQRKLTDIWSEVLKVDKVGIRDNYYALGGDSMRSITILSLARKQGISFSLNDLLQRQTIESVLAEPHTEEKDQSTSPFALINSEDQAVLPDFVEDAYPLTQLQAGMLFHGDYASGATAYQDVFTFHLKAPLDRAAMNAALNSIVNRHAILRTAFDLTSYSQPLQLVHREVELEIGGENWSNLPEHALEATLNRWITSEQNNKFERNTAPLIRFNLHPRESGTFQFTLTFHHAILDGWSVATLLVELLQEYLHVLKLTNKELPSIPALEFRDFVKLEIDTVADSEVREFWSKKLEGYKFNQIPRSASVGSKKQTLRRDLGLSDEQSLKIVDLAQSLGLSVRTLFLAIHARVIGLISGHSDIVTGLVSNGRPEQAGGDQITGLFLNTLPFRIEFPQGSWIDLAKAVDEIEKSYWPNRRMPLAEIQKMHNGNPLFETDFNYVHFHIYQSTKAFNDVEFLSGRVEEETNFVIAANFSQDSENSKFEASLSLDASVISLEHADAIVRYYEAAIARFVNDPNSSCLDDSHVLLAECEKTDSYETSSVSDSLDGRMVHEIIQEQVARSPESIALIDAKGQAMTYRSLNNASNQLAHLLRHHGVGTESRVAVCLERSVDQVISLLAVMKAGGAYIPIDGKYAKERQDYILDDSRANVLLTYKDAEIAITKPISIVYMGVDFQYAEKEIHENLPALDLTDSLAYIIYTSGSTGQPKGVEISHGALSNHMQWMLGEFPLLQEDRILQKTSFCFDASIWEFWLPLMSGAPLILSKQTAQFEVVDLVESIQYHRISILQVVPSLLEVLLQTPSFFDCVSLRRIFSGGEELRGDVSAAFLKSFPNVELINLYGPTETTIDATYFRCEKMSGDDSIPIGHPIDNVSTYVLDYSMNPTPVWTPGMLYLGGAGLARGYSNQSGLTASQFVPDPFSDVPGALLYRTGDMAFKRSDGALVFSGRVDDQIKLRGFRIELSEIDAKLTEHPEVLQSVTVFNKEGARKHRSLISFVVSKTVEPLMGSKLRDHLAGKLADHMIPAVFVSLKNLPLNSSGKIDRRKLLGFMPKEHHSPERKWVKPKTEAEHILVRIWSSVLQVEPLGVTENFFDLGGDSILSLQIVAKCAQSGWKITSKDVFDYQTVQNVASHATKLITGKLGQSTPEGEAILLPIQRAFFEQKFKEPNHWNQSILLNVPPGFSVKQLRKSIDQIVAHHDSFRLRYQKISKGWNQYFVKDVSETPIEEVDISSKSSKIQNQSIAVVGEKLQSGLDIHNGPVLSLAYFNFGDVEQGRLLVVAHHLVMDAVSWRILLEDFALLYTTDFTQGKVQLPEKTASYQQWGNLLDQYANEDHVQKELEYWGNVSRNQVLPLPQDIQSSSDEDTEVNAASVSRSLSKQDTQALLQDVPSAYRTQVNDVLLTALLETIAVWQEGDTLLVNMEGHGREEIFEDVSLARSVGWFTTLFPVAIHRPEVDDLSVVLKSVKEQLRQLPNRGLGYGVLRYLAHDESIRRRLEKLPTPEISFNYLGQVDLDVSNSAVFSPAIETPGAEHGPSNKRSHSLDLIALISHGEFKVQWIYGSKSYHQKTIESLADGFMGHLQKIIVHCLQPANRGYTPSDFPLACLEQEPLDVLLKDRPAVENLFPLSPLQEGLLYHAAFDDQAGLYNQQITSEFHGPLDLDSFDKAWRYMIERHGIFRTSFLWSGTERALQCVHQKVDCPTRYLDWRELSDSELDNKWVSYLENDRAQPFDWSQAPLMRLVAIRIRDDYWRLVWSHHHLLLDGWSMPIVFKELLASYRSFCEGRELQFPVPRPYFDYISSIQKLHKPDESSFWKKGLGGFEDPSRLDLKSDLVAEITDQVEFNEIEVSLSLQFSDQLRQVAKTHRLTLNTFMQGMWALLLARYNGRSDIVYGVTVSGRSLDLEGIESMVGLFINTLPIRISVNSKASMLEFLRSVQTQQSALSQFEHSRLSEVLKWCDLPAGQTLIESILIFENYPIDENLSDESSSDFRVSNVQSIERTNFPLAFYVTPGEQIHLRLIYRSPQFPDKAMGRVIEQAQVLLRNMAEGIDAAVSEAGLMTAATVADTYSVLNRSHESYDVLGFVHRRFHEQVLKNPNHVAVVFNEDELSYEELDLQSNQMAHYLRKHGAGPESLIAIFLNRSPAMMVGLLGILKSGAGYVPMDPDFPNDRLSMMLEDSAAPIVITESELLERLPESKATPVVIDREGDAIRSQPVSVPESSVDPENTAYVIFTSGSTGRPKGVQIPHRALTNFLNTFQKRPGIQSDDVLMAVTTLSFDISALELFLPLISGAKLVLVDRDTSADGDLLAIALKQHECTVMQGTPATWKLLLASGWTPSESFRIWCGGESFPKYVAERLLKSSKEVWNLYGPTETTIWSSISRIQKTEDTRFIGHPIGNTQLYIVDADLNPLPKGGIGELCIGGDGLAHGYWNRPDLTAERFIPDPFSGRDGSRLYRTGDRARFQEGETIEFLGRLDFQVKIRGFRVELGDIETAIRSHAHIHDCVVLVREDQSDQKQLVAYLVTKRQVVRSELTDELRDILADRLPAYMMPGFFVFLETLPLTPNNKIDRRALPMPNVSGAVEGTNYVAPRDVLEEAIAGIWSDVLGQSKIGVKNGFFEIGGDSLLAAQVLSWIRKIFHIDMSIRRVFESPTIELLVVEIRRLEKKKGQFEKIAQAILKIRNMTPEERSRMKKAGSNQK